MEQQLKEKPEGSKIFRVTVRIADATDGPPEVSEEIVAYELTNETQGNFVLRKIGDTGKGRLNLQKVRVRTSPNSPAMIIRRNTSIGEEGQVWASSETWVWDELGKTVDIVKNDIYNHLTTVIARARRVQDTIG